MLNINSTITKGIAFATACMFGAATISCTVPDDPTTGQPRISVTTPAGDVQSMTGTWDEVVGPFTADLVTYVADGLATTDPAQLLQAARSVFNHPDGRVLIIVRDAHGSLSVSDKSSVASPFVISWTSDLDVIIVETPSGPAQIQLERVPVKDRARVVGSMAATTLALGETTFIHGLNADKVAPWVIAIGIVFGSWLACVTLGTAICGTSCALQCWWGGGSVASSSMNCGVNITWGTGTTAGGIGNCTCTCNPPPTPMPTPTPTATPTATPSAPPAP